MSIFGPQVQGPTRINQVQINQSVLGYALPAGMGRFKVQQSILWTDGFKWTKIAQGGGGKGFGGGKGGTQYVYSADVIAALCAGPVIGIADVWSGQSWLHNTNANETYTITGGTPTYTPVNASSMTSDQGAGLVRTYSATVTDLGSSATTLAGYHLAPLKRVAYGSALPTGTYSIDPVTNVYYFSPSDVGQTVELSYSYALSTIYKQQVDLVPSGLTIAVGGSLPFASDGGVVYASGVHEGQAVPHYVSGSAPATYHFYSADVGKEVRITYSLDNSSTLPDGTSKSVNFTLFEGYQGQEPWYLLDTNFPGASLGYSNVALVAYGPMDLGYGAQIQQNTFEALTPDGWGAGINDCSPVQCILQVLTNPVWGLGAGAVPFPVSAIDNGAGGTWGTPGPGQTIHDGTATAWFAANGFFISPLMDKQDTAASLISRWIEAGQCAAFMSEGLLKLVPYGDTSVAGNGAIWEAPSYFAVALDDTCFSAEDGQEPVKISSTPYMDAYNTVQIAWSNRDNQYATEVTPESDQAAINRYGSRIEDPQTYDFIRTLAAATFAGSMRVKRNVYARNTYTFRLPYQYAYLEPMDVCPISTTSVWAAGLNNENLGIVNKAVRITKIVDNPDGTLDVTAEDYPFGVYEPVIYNKDIAQGQAQPNQYSAPGDASVVIFNAPPRLTNFKGGQIWIGAAGATAAWGGCNVLASMDGAKYIQIGTVEAPARLGTLSASLPSGSDPDTVNSLVVNLIGDSSGLEAGTTADADAGNTLCYVDGEILSYSACTVTGPDQYTASGYLRRAQRGSYIAAHASGAPFLRLDDSVLRYSYDASWAGKTVYLKFQSFNTYNNSAQDVSTLTAVPFTVAQQFPGTIVVSGTTPNPVVSTAALTGLPELTASDALMTITTDGSAGQAGVNLDFRASTGGGASGQVTYLGVTFSSVFGNAPPSISISITGDGSGASASVGWSPSGGTYPNNPPFTWTPTLYIAGGSGYTTATATVTVSNAVGTYSNGTTSYTCTLSAGGGSLVSGAQVKVRVLMDGLPIIGSTVVTDANGAASLSFSQVVFPASGAHTFEVQAMNLSTATVQSINRTFQYIALG